MEWHFLPSKISPVSPSGTFADILALAVRSVSESGWCLCQWDCRSPQSGLSHEKMSVVRPVELVLSKWWINFYCISINHYFAVAILTTPGVCCWCGVIVHQEEPSPHLKRWLCWHNHCVEVQEQTHCTEEAIYSSRNGIMRMRGWKTKPEISNMKWDTHVQLWVWYALAKHNLVSLVQGELSEM